ATGAGIGLFIALIGLVNAHIVVATNFPDAPLGPGAWRSPETAVALIGLLITIVLMARKIPGALVIGILLTTAIAFPFHVAHWPDQFALPTFSAAFHADVIGALKWSATPPLLFAVIMVDFFDTIGTATAIAEEANLIDDQGRIPGIRAILLVDSLSAAVGGMLGASSVTCYIDPPLALPKAPAPACIPSSSDSSFCSRSSLPPSPASSPPPPPRPPSSLLVS
ncbi:MAG TPA: solute carrier family 23 protein, partial [Tepidisphaeraceae bacterium]|nr:solute carrier family 23 protein [Tepidisphaeraceae bacterium]